MNNTTYGYTNPVAQLLTTGYPKSDSRAETWPDYLATYGLTSEHLPELIRLAHDLDTFWNDTNRLDDDDPAIYGIVHAICAIGQLKTVAGMNALLKLSVRNEVEGWETDWLYDYIPSAIGLLGEPALAPIEAFLANSNYSASTRASLVETPGYIANADPALRSQVVDLYRRQLANYQQHSRWLNASYIHQLVVLGDVDSADLIKEAHLANKVDLSLAGDWEEAFIELGLLTERETPPKHWLAAESEAFEVMKREQKQKKQLNQFRRQMAAKKRKKAKRKKKRKR